MKALAVKSKGTTFAKGDQGDVAVIDLSASLEKAGVDVVVKIPKLIINEKKHFHFPFAGATLERVDEGRSAGAAAGGAAAGALLLGPLGLLAGAALGGRKRHTLMLRYGENFLLFEASTSDLQFLAGKGLVTPL